MRRRAWLGLGALALLVFAGAFRALHRDGGAELTTARAFLAAYHGDRWPALERAIEAAGEDLDRPYRFTPWEAVASHFDPSFEIAPEDLAVWIEDRVGWPAAASAEWIEESYTLGLDAGLAPDELAFLEALLADANHALLEKATLWGLTLAEHVRGRRESGDFVRAPFTTAGLATGHGTFTRSAAGYGWAVTITLEPGDHPDLDVLEDELAALADRRDGIVIEFLQARAAR